MKKELKTKLTQERIIEAALIEFSQKGYKAFGINELCKNHKISKGILYHNFSGKTELLYEVDALKDLKEDYLETFAVSEEVQLKELGEGLLKRTGQAVLRVLSPLF